MSRKRKVLLIIAAGVAILVAIVSYFDRDDPAHLSIQIHLRWLGASIYDYHAKTGKWPARSDDLAITSLPRKSRYWKTMLQDEVYVMLWPRDLKPAPEDNANVILTYHNKGLYAHLGRVWVCWGDLRTEYVTSEELEAYLEARKE